MDNAHNASEGGHGTRSLGLTSAAATAALIAAGAAVQAHAGSINEAEQVGTQRVVVEISDFRNDRGEALVALFRTGEGFPTDPLKAAQRVAGPIQEGKSRVVFEGLAPGEFAISVLHDEDGNREVRTGIFGIPKEGLGFSRDPRVMFGPPKFKNARLELPTGENPVVPIHMKYF
jgi:uncharacterized protein (DUF2141 family)